MTKPAARLLLEAAAGDRLNDQDVARLAEALADSGVRLEADPEAADLTSTGGPSSLSTLLVPLYLRAGGRRVPKLGVAGRPAGGVDILKTIPGYDASPPPELIRSRLRGSGYVHVEAGDIWAPLDSILFRMRQEMGFQAVAVLVIASILAKKLAMGVQYVGLEVRVSPFGNFGRFRDQARANAQRFNRVAGLLGLESLCFLTDARVPFQPYIGRGEALVALSLVLEGTADEWLASHDGLCRRMGNSLVSERSRAVDISELKNANCSLLEAHGASERAFQDRVHDVRSEDRREIVAQESGWPVYDLEGIRDTIVASQRRVESERRITSDPAGVILMARPNHRVSAGDRLALVRSDPTNDPGLFQSLADCVFVETRASPGEGQDGLVEVVHA